MKNSPVLLPAVLCAFLALAWFFYRDPAPIGAPSVPVNLEGNFLLALTWQPAFCETKPTRPECETQTEGRFDTRNFTLHGLWPQPYGNFYCGVPESLKRQDLSGNWLDLPRLPISGALRRELEIKMPGYQSGLHRHEWFKHGTCMPGFAPETYFRLSLDLLDSFNRSAPAAMFRNNPGEPRRTGELVAAFDSSFGKGAGQRVLFECSNDGNRRLYREFRISISGRFAGNIPLSDLISEGKTVPRSCPRGIIDPPGLQ